MSFPGAPANSARYVRFTGHPPPAEQIRGQVRSSTGATYVGRMTAFAAPATEIAQVTEGEAAKAHARNLHRLVRLLAAIEQTGHCLPYADAIAVHIADDWTEAKVSRALEGLRQGGDLQLRRYTGEGRQREFSVKLGGGVRWMHTPGLDHA
jgi:hypothetical protein